MATGDVLCGRRWASPPLPIYPHGGPADWWWMGGMFWVAGFGLGMCMPPLYELAAELTFPGVHPLSVLRAEHLWSGAQRRCLCGFSRGEHLRRPAEPWHERESAFPPMTDRMRYVMQKTRHQCG